MATTTNFFLNKKKHSKTYQKDSSCHFDRKRMEYALSTETIELPRGLTREEKRKFIIEHSKGL